MSVRINRDLLIHIPDGATHCAVEERLHRGEPVFAVVAIVPDGASIPLNGYSTQDLAESTAQAINEYLSPELYAVDWDEDA